jgi:hypothetical protein
MPRWDRPYGPPGMLRKLVARTSRTVRTQNCPLTNHRSQRWQRESMLENGGGKNSICLPNRWLAFGLSAAHTLVRTTVVAATLLLSGTSLAASCARGYFPRRASRRNRKKRLAVSRCESSIFTLSPLFGWLCTLGSRGTVRVPHVSF